MDDILIIPSWEQVKPEDESKMIIHIDPGTAFGTGMHETTQLCMRQLKKYVTSETELLDVGTGSGILSIVALKLGAKHAVGTDLDPCAISATKENLEANAIPEGSMDVMIGNIIDDKEVQDAAGYDKYDIVTANILADVLVPLTPVIIHQMKKGGIYITSGIIDDKEENGCGSSEKSRSYGSGSNPSGRVGIRHCKKGFFNSMHHFFVEPSKIQGNHIFIDGPDVNHIRNVLRMNPGEEVNVTDGSGEKVYRCAIAAIGEDTVELNIMWAQEKGMELPSKIYLFQGLPKSDKMELIIQKAVELGVYEIIPMATARAVVKLDQKKAAAKVKRWQAISESAAKQSKRLLIPEVKEPVKFSEALKLASDLDVRLIPYELAEGMDGTRRIIQSVKPGQSVAVFIGPEGGFEEAEVELAKEAGFQAITLGRRILRTETAGMTVLSILMYQLEEN